jgi:hypothetical protein
MGRPVLDGGILGSFVVFSFLSNLSANAIRGAFSGIDLECETTRIPGREEFSGARCCRCGLACFVFFRTRPAPYRVKVETAGHRHSGLKSEPPAALRRLHHPRPHVMTWSQSLPLPVVFTLTASSNTPQTTPNNKLDPPSSITSLPTHIHRVHFVHPITSWHLRAKHGP